MRYLTHYFSFGNIINFVFLLFFQQIVFSQDSIIIKADCPFLSNGTVATLSSSYPSKSIFPNRNIEVSTVIKDHRFQMVLNIENPERFQLTIQKNNETLQGYIFLQAGICNLVITDSLLKEIKVLNNKTGMEYYEFHKKLERNKLPDVYFSFSKNYKNALISGDTALGLNYFSKIDSIENDLKYKDREIVYNWIKKNPKSHINSLLLKQFMYGKIPEKEIKTIYNNLSSFAQKNSWGKELHFLVSNLIIGKKLPKFSLKDTSGEKVSLREFHGNYLLLDFWASWCIPCREQSEALMSLYNKYKKEGLVLVCISLDKKEEDWKKAIFKDSLNCINLSDLKGFDGIAKEYMIKSIPANFLLDRNGLIIAKNGEITDLENLLKKVIPK